jgi:hypothetical protein
LGVAGGAIAFIDESMRLSRGRGLYLVAAAIVAHGDQATVERRLRALTGRRQKRRHWHDEIDTLRFGFMDELAELPLRAVTVAVESITPRRQEKAREVALWNLLPHLEPHGVTNLVLEARQEQLNRRDRRTIWAIQRCAIGVGMSYRFGRPTEDAMLWVADALAGALGLHVAEGDDRFIKRLPDDLRTLHRVGG